jgi:ABC-type uncharacterized transport system permease subunit
MALGEVNKGKAAVDRLVRMRITRGLLLLLQGLLLCSRLRLLSVVPLRQGVVLCIGCSGLAGARPDVPWIVIVKGAIQSLL